MALALAHAFKTTYIPQMFFEGLSRAQDPTSPFALQALLPITILTAVGVAAVSGVVSLATNSWLLEEARLTGVWEMVMAPPGVRIGLPIM